MKKIFFLGIIILLIITAVFLFVRNYQPSQKPVLTVTDFESCAAAGYPILESYPRQCRTPDGRNFGENIGNTLEKKDLIQVSSPRPNDIVKSPLSVKGQARGYWFFEASFPVRLEDDKGQVVASGIARALSDWMTENFVPFEAELSFSTPESKKGILILQKDNPSGLPENEDRLVFPVYFDQNKIIGGDKDEHGCLIAAGYSWCQAKQKCLRVWEESCQ
jgi:hypothetical protein